jgi:hypothetical protein
MSHLTTIKTTFTDLDCLKQAVKALGWTLNQGGKVRYYYGEGQGCDYTINFNAKEAASEGLKNNKYNIGVNKQEDGPYVLLHDNAMEGYRVLPKDQFDSITNDIISKLQQQYNVSATKKHVASLKKKVKQQQINANGDIILTIS